MSSKWRATRGRSSPGDRAASPPWSRLPVGARFWGGLLSSAALLLGAPVLGQASDRPPVVLITIDTLRADHLGFAGYPLAVSPTLDRLARAGTWFPRCYSHSSTTGASQTTIFTSRLPPEHGVLANRGRFPKMPTLMSALEQTGYETAAFVSSVVLGRQLGIDAQFDHFDDQFTRREANRTSRAERPAGDTLAAALRFLAGRQSPRPVFVWVHLIDPHGPYVPPVEPDRFVGNSLYARERRALAIGEDDFARLKIPFYQALGEATDSAFYRARYDAEIRYADDELGQFVEGLEKLGLWSRALVSVIADHGETLDEPGRERFFSHSVVAYEEVVHVPWIVREPAGQHRLDRVKRERPVTSLDFAPTLLSLLGIAAPSTFRGRDLLKASLPPDLPIVSYGAYGTDLLEREIGTQFTLRAGRWRYVVASKGGREELFDQQRDPHGLLDVADRNRDVLARMRREMAPVLASRGKQEKPPPLLPDQAERMRSLGYVQ
jgi:choline-sulfatase